jgi:hypothetical protein
MGKVSLIDDSDYEKISKHKYTAIKGKRTFYAYRGSKLAGRIPYQKNLYMHREIMNAPDNMQVDHINGNGLDNRRSNLRLVSNAQNSRHTTHSRNNKTGYRGVFQNSNETHRWFSSIMVDYKTKFLGYFDSPIDAARAYDKAAKELHGEFATLNFPDE